MVYKGWKLLAIVRMPRAYEIENTGATKNFWSTIIFGKEVQFYPKLLPKNYQPYLYIANKEGKQLEAQSVATLRQLIDKEEEK